MKYKEKKRKFKKKTQDKEKSSSNPRQHLGKFNMNLQLKFINTEKEYQTISILDENVDGNSLGILSNKVIRFDHLK